MFRASLCPSSEATTTALKASGLPSELGDSSAVGRGWASWTTTNSTAITNQRLLLQPLMMGMRVPKTC